MTTSNFLVGPGEGWDDPVMVTLTQADLHNLQAILTSARKETHGIHSRTLVNELLAKLKDAFPPLVLRP